MKWLFAFLISAAMHASPVIRDIVPHGAQRGKSVTLHIKGSGLKSGAKLQTTLPAAITRLVPTAGAENELPFLITVNADAPVGLYPIRILSNDGMSNLVLFSVGDLPETETKVKTKEERDKAQPINIPILVNGNLAEAEQDDYLFSARAGQKLVCTAVEAYVKALASPVCWVRRTARILHTERIRDAFIGVGALVDHVHELNNVAVLSSAEEPTSCPECRG